jgi:hypothetical protein
MDAQQVIALRAMKIAAGGAAAHPEVARMMTEKVSAAAGAAAILALAESSGVTEPTCVAISGAYPRPGKR